MADYIIFQQVNGLPILVELKGESSKPNTKKNKASIQLKV